MQKKQSQGCVLSPTDSFGAKTVDSNLDAGPSEPSGGLGEPEDDRLSNHLGILNKYVLCIKKPDKRESDSLTEGSIQKLKLSIFF